MSGIFGFYIEKEEQQKVDIKNSIDRLKAWNGPYGSHMAEVYAFDKCVLGCCLDDTFSKDKQKKSILHKSKKVAVMDVLLYNAEELMKKCEINDEISDEELLLIYIEKFGMQSLCKVNADMAGAIWDEERRALTLFRDHMGVRPLFYYEKGNDIVFSTDIRGITALPWTNVSINEEMLYRTICGYATLDLENTEFAHIFCVPPGSYVTFIFEEKKVKKTIKQYWEIGRKKIRFRTEQEYFNEMKSLVTDAIRRRTEVVSGPIGAELSGGLDSGVIDILINRLGREGIYFSWSPSVEEVPLAEGDERIVIEDICKQENISCNYGKRFFRIEDDMSFLKNVQNITGKCEKEELEVFHYVFPPYINTISICESSDFIKRAGGKVVFTGHGGDEGVSHRCNMYEMFYYKEYYHFFRYIWSLSHGEKGRVKKTLRTSFEKIKELKQCRNTPFQNQYAVPKLLNDSFRVNYEKKKMPVLSFAYDPITYIKAGGSRNRLDNVALFGAYSGVRYMVPYLDYRVIDFAVSIPRHMYLKKGKNRYIFRETFKDIMPKSLYTLRFKEDNSRKNMKSAEPSKDEVAHVKQLVMNKLDREYWSKYLNFDEVDAWLKSDKSSDEERNISRGLMSCAVLQNMVEKSRDIL